MPQEVESPEKTVLMRHTKTSGLALTTVAAFEEAHSQKGWTRSISNVSIEVLRDYANQAGFIVDEMGKPELLKALGNVAPAKKAKAKTEKKSGANSSADDGAQSGAGDSNPDDTQS